MAIKNSSRTVWVVVLTIIAAFFLYVSFAGRALKPQPEDEFPTEQAAPST